MVIIIKNLKTTATKKIKYIIIFLFCLIIPHIAFAYAPISGGPITSPFGPRNVGGRASTFHHGVDVGTSSGTPIYAPADGTVGHGAGGGYIYWCDITGNDGNYYLFGDCQSDTLTCATGYVKAGTLIGYTGGDYYDGPLGYSNGAHVHIEVHPGGENFPAVNPVPYLQKLGVSLSGTSNTSTTGASDNITVPWGVENMYQIGDTINSTMKSIVNVINSGYSALQKIGYYLLGIFCVLDLCLPILRSLNITFDFLVRKLIKFGFLFAFLENWQSIINNFFLSFVKTTSSVFTSDSTVISTNISQPQLLLQKGIFMVTPAIKKIAEFGSIDFLRNFGEIFPIYFFTFLVIFIFFAVSCYIMLAYIEFYFFAAISVFAYPFSALGYTKFLGEGALGGLVTHSIKLLATCIMVALAVTCIKDASPGDIFKVTSTATTITGTASISGASNLVSIAKEKAQKYDIPQTLFLAQIQTESSWNPNAVSSVGAEGLGQLMPSTAAGLGCEDPFDPESNLEAAAKYMRQLHDQFGDWNYALAAYNGGPASITKGEPLPGWAKAYINQVNGNLSGSYISVNSISTEAMTKYILMCTALIALAILTVYIPSVITNKLGGKFELS